MRARQGEGWGQAICGATVVSARRCLLADSCPVLERLPRRPTDADARPSRIDAHVGHSRRADRTADAFSRSLADATANPGVVEEQRQAPYDSNSSRASSDGGCRRGESGMHRRRRRCIPDVSGLHRASLRLGEGTRIVGAALSRTLRRPRAPPLGRRASSDGRGPLRPTGGTDAS